MTLVGLYFRPLNFGIDFKGGLLFEVRFTHNANLANVRKALNQLNVGEIVLQQIGEDKRDIMIKIRSRADVAQKDYIDTIRKAISSKIDPQADFRKLEYIGAEVGHETALKALLALGLTLLGIQAYIWCRFSLWYALGIVIGLMHTLILTVGFLVATQYELSSTSIAALLTVLGYSVNDTVVIYDRIRANMKKYRKLQPEEVINQSINETILRTIFTGITTLLATCALIIFGGEALYTFSVTVFMGIIIGTYSSVFISVPYLSLFLSRSQ